MKPPICSGNCLFHNIAHQNWRLTLGLDRLDSDDAQHLILKRFLMMEMGELFRVIKVVNSHLDFMRFPDVTI